jgi:hypothetical protein
VSLVAFQGEAESGNDNPVDPSDEFGGFGSVEEFVKENGQRGMRQLLQAQGRLAHFGNASANGLHMLREEIGVMGERGLEFVNGLRSDPRGQDLMQTNEAVVKTFEARDTLINAHPRLGRVGDRP